MSPPLAAEGRGFVGVNFIVYSTTALASAAVGRGPLATVAVVIALGVSAWKAAEFSKSISFEPSKVAKTNPAEVGAPVGGRVTQSEVYTIISFPPLISLVVVTVNTLEVYEQVKVLES